MLGFKLLIFLLLRDFRLLVVVFHLICLLMSGLWANRSDHWLCVTQILNLSVKYIYIFSERVAIVSFRCITGDIFASCRWSVCGWYYDLPVVSFRCITGDIFANCGWSVCGWYYDLPVVSFRCITGDIFASCRWSVCGWYYDLPVDVWARGGNSQQVLPCKDHIAGGCRTAQNKGKQQNIVVVHL